MPPHSSAAVLAIFALAPAALAQWTMTNLHPAGSSSSYAYQVDGERIAGYGYFSSPARQSAGMWNGLSAAQWVELAPPPATSTISWAFALGGTNGGGGGAGAQQGGQYVPVGQSNGRACWWSGTSGSFVDLHPTTGGFLRSGVLGITQGQQWGWVQDASFLSHATVWSGTAASRIDFSPPGTRSSGINASDGARQVGYFTLTSTGGLSQACVWYNSPTNAFNFHPGGVYSSTINALHQGQLVGSFTVGPNINDGRACMWTISPEGNVSIQSLHTEGINAQSSVAYGVHGGVQVGNVTINNLTRASVWFGNANTREDPLPILPVGTTQTEARGVYTTPTTITVVGMISRPGGNWNAVAWTKPNTPPPCSPADIGSAGGAPGPDGHLDNNDFIVFINDFFNQSPSADIGVAGGIAGHDSAFDNNDFIVFINLFFEGQAGC